MGKLKTSLWVLIVSFFLLPLHIQARMITQITPTLTISEEYTDNFLETSDDTQEEWTTIYQLGFTMGWIDKVKQIYLAYHPEYRDYKNFNDRDSLDHNANLNGSFQASKQTLLEFDLGYDGHGGNYQGESWEHTASALLSSDITKHTSLSISQEYSKVFDQQERTGIYKEHQVNTTNFAIDNQFGEKDFAGLDFSYEFDDYTQSDQDEYDQYNVSGFITYWMTPLNGIDSNISYENRMLDNSIDDIKTYEGYVRYLRKFTKHLDGYLKYRHYLSRQDSGDHTIYHPSFGFDWDVTRDSGISVGLGVLFHDWKDGSTSTDPFFDIDVYKIYNFSRRGSLTLSASSGYEESTGEDINQGFSTYYQADCSLDYMLSKRFSSNVYGKVRLDDFHGPSTQNEDTVLTNEIGARLDHQMSEKFSYNLYSSYTQEEYHEVSSTRQDKSIDLGCELTWLPLRWLRFAVSYEFTDFQSDSSERGDSTENAITFSVSLIPERPITSDRINSFMSVDKEPNEN